MPLTFQLLGIMVRADIPLGLDLLTSLWKVLVSVDLDPVVDLKAADHLTYNYIKKIEMVGQAMHCRLFLITCSPLKLFVSYYM